MFSALTRAPVTSWSANLMASSPSLDVCQSDTEEFDLKEILFPLFLQRRRRPPDRRRKGACWATFSAWSAARPHAHRTPSSGSLNVGQRALDVGSHTALLLSAASAMSLTPTLPCGVLVGDSSALRFDPQAAISSWRG